MKNVTFAVVVLFALVLSGCTSRLTDFTVISTKNTPIGTQPINLVKAEKRVKGVDKSHIILFFPIGTPHLKEAIDRAIEQYPGAVALADGVVKSKFMDFFFYGQQSYIVEGTPLYPADLQQVSNQNASTLYVRDSNNNNIPAQDYMRITHEVSTEKNVSELAKMYEVSVPDIMKWNRLSSPILHSGQKVVIYLRE